MSQKNNPKKEIQTQEATAAAGGASTGAFSGPFFQTMERDVDEGLNLFKKPKLNAIANQLGLKLHQLNK